MNQLCPALTLLQKECHHCIATIQEFSNMDQNTLHKLTRLGVCKGCSISLGQNTIFSDPIIFRVNNSQIAIRKHDAQNILIMLPQ